MADLTPEEKQRIYQEEKVRLEAQKTVKAKASFKETCAGCGCLVVLSVVILLVVASIFGNSTKNDNNSNKKLQTAKLTSKHSSKQGHQVNDPVQADPISRPDLEVLNYTSESDEYSRYITGTIRNNTDRSYGYVQVEINLYDNSGSQVGSTIANINNLDPKGVWKFKAPLLEEKASKFSIKDVTGF